MEQFISVESTAVLIGCWFTASILSVGGWNLAKYRVIRASRRQAMQPELVASGQTTQQRVVASTPFRGQAATLRSVR